MTNLNREPILIKTDTYILKETYIDAQGDTVWEIKDPKNNNIFFIHSSPLGQLYINFFKGNYISTNCSLNAIKKLCEILLSRQLHPTIKIYYTNESLIRLCCSVGFRKDKKVKHQYYLKNLK